MKIKLNYDIRVKFYPKGEREGKEAAYGLLLQIDSPRILYKLTFPDASGKPKGSDWTAIYDGAKTSWASRDGKAALSLVKPGLVFDKFVYEGIGLPCFGFDYPGIPFVKIMMPIPASEKGQSSRKFIGSMLKGADYGVTPPGPGYTQPVVIVKDMSDRIIRCGTSVNNVPVDLWTLSNYRKFDDLALPMLVRHQVGYMTGGRRGAKSVQFRPEDLENAKVPGVTCRNDFDATYRFVSRG